MGLLLLLIATSSIWSVSTDEITKGNRFSRSPGEQPKHWYEKWIVDDLFAITDHKATLIGTSGPKKRRKCHVTFQKVMGCVEKENYRLHHIPSQSQVKITWFLSKLLNSPEKLELLKDLLNTKLDAVIEEKLENFKTSTMYKNRLEKDVNTKFDQFVVDSVSSEVKDLEDKYVENKKNLLKLAAMQHAIHVDKILQRIQEERKVSIPTPPPYDGSHVTTDSPEPFTTMIPFPSGLRSTGPPIWGWGTDNTNEFQNRRMYNGGFDWDFGSTSAPVPFFYNVDMW